MKLFYFATSIWGFQLILSSFALKSNEICYLKSKINNFVWNLIWENDFKTNRELDDWKSLHDKCHEKMYKQKSCNIESNVNTYSGFLVMKAKHQRYHGYNYTGAMVTSKKSISYGRVEVRASLPVGDQLRVCIYASGPTDASGQVEICAQQSQLTRSVYYPEMKQTFLFQKTNLFNDMHPFHVYAFEWDQRGIRFFLDDNYTGSHQFNETYKLYSPLNLRMFIGVGLEKPVLESFTDLNWKCPNFVIDYVRYYHKVFRREILNECQKNDYPRYENFTLESICGESMKLMPSIWDDSNNISKNNPKQAISVNFILLFGTILTLLVCFIIWYIKESRI